jgi:Zn-dependent protease with chaperone function
MTTIQKTVSDAYDYVKTTRPYEALAYVCEPLKKIALKILDYVFPKNEMTNCREIRFIPTRFENYIGEKCFNTICPASKVCKDEALKLRVKTIFDKLIEKCPRKNMKWEVRVLEDDKTINAACLPGGKVFITTGIIKKLNEQYEFDKDKEFKTLTLDDHIAAVLGHEIVHAAAAHGARKMQLGAMITIAAGIGTIALPFILSRKSTPTEDKKTNARENTKSNEKPKEESKPSVIPYLLGFGILYKLGRSLLMHKHSRCNEFESDKWGIKLAHEAGYDVNASVRLQKMFIKLKDDLAPAVKKSSDGIMELFSTHPPSVERLEANKKTIEDIKAKGLEAAFAT